MSDTNPEITVKPLFCPRDHCAEKLLSVFKSANSSIYCALFEVDLPEIIETLTEKSHTIEVELYVDNLHFDHVKNVSFAHHDNRSALMHNKFCIIDTHTVVTGSFNPTERGNYYNNNNLVIIESLAVADMYEREFKEFSEGVFGGGDYDGPQKIIGYNTTLEILFCPEDHCAQALKRAIQKANHSIVFMAFSFTHGGIATDMILQNVSLKGIMEKRNAHNKSVYPLFHFQGANVTKDLNPYNMHHKVFIIDEKTVITGSFNPSQNADRYNDENLLIIENRRVAKAYLEEFNRLSAGLKKGQSLKVGHIEYNPEGNDKGKEFIELYNPLNISVDLEYVFLSADSGNIRLNGTILPNQTVKIYPDFSLKNKMDTVILRNTTHVLDTKEWGRSPGVGSGASKGGRGGN